MLTRFMRTVLFEIGAYYPTVLLAVLAALSTSILMACAVPALRARRVDPASALNGE